MKPIRKACAYLQTIYSYVCFLGVFFFDSLCVCVHMCVFTVDCCGFTHEHKMKIVCQTWYQYMLTAIRIKIMCMCVCVHTCVYIHVCVYMCMCVCVCVCVCVHVCVCESAHVCMCVSVWPAHSHLVLPFLCLPSWWPVSMWLVVQIRTRPSWPGTCWRPCAQTSPTCCWTLLPQTTCCPCPMKLSSLRRYVLLCWMTAPSGGALGPFLMI